MKTTKDYIPFGKEWEKEMNTLPKKALVSMLRKQLDWAELRKEFHKETLIKSSTGHWRYNMFPNDMFEWFKLKINNKNYNY